MFFYPGNYINCSQPNYCGQLQYVTSNCGASSCGAQCRANNGACCGIPLVGNCNGGLVTPGCCGPVVTPASGLGYYGGSCGGVPINGGCAGLPNQYPYSPTIIINKYYPPTCGSRRVVSNLTRCPTV